MKRYLALLLISVLIFTLILLPAVASSIDLAVMTDEQLEEFRGAIDAELASRQTLAIDYNALAEYTILIFQSVLKKDESLHQQAVDVITLQAMILAVTYPEGTIDILTSQISGWLQTKQGQADIMFAAMMYDNISTRDQAIETLADKLKDVIILPTAK